MTPEQEHHRLTHSRVKDICYISKEPLTKETEAAELYKQENKQFFVPIHKRFKK